MEVSYSVRARTRFFIFHFASVVLFTALGAAFFLVAPPARAAITETAPPIEAFFESPLNVGGGTVFPYVQFRLSQSSGADTLSKIGVQIFASTTISQGEIARVSLWQESGTKQGFQVDQDTFIAGAASTSPMVDGTLILLTPTTAVSVGTSPTEFFIVASTTGISGITNSDGFDIRMQANYASTTGGGVGNAFTPGRRVILSQTAPLKISEARLGSATNSGDEFIELYNDSDAAVNLSDLPLALHAFYASGSSSPIALTFYKKVIPAHGFFLIASQINYSGSTPPDAVFATTSSNLLVIDGGFSIATSSVGTRATSTKIDMLCWGAQPALNCENTDTALSVGGPLNLEDSRSMERVARGYPNATSTASSLATGGTDATRGNSIDRNDNSADFVIQTPANPQNTMSPTEFAFGGGGGGQSESLRVQGSFPSNNQTNVPSDFPFIGFMFSQPASTSTVNTTSVTLTLTAGGSNLCTTVTYNPFPSNYEPPGKCNLTASLSPSTSYTFTASTSIQNLQGGALDQDQFQAGNQGYTAVFTTGAAGQTFTNTTPPAVVGTSPFPGSSNIPLNLAIIAVEFNQQNMNLTTLTSTNVTLASNAGASIALTGFALSTSTGKNIMTFAPGALAANTTYILTVGAGVRNGNNVPLPAPYIATFMTGGVTDTSAPVIIGLVPGANTVILPSANDFVFMFDDAIDATTATSGSITLGITNGAALPGSVFYDPVAKEGHFTASNVLPTGASITLTIGTGLKNISGVRVASAITNAWTVAAQNTDTTPPSVLSANADEFSVAITYNEAVNSTDATTLANYTLTVAGAAQTLSALSGNTLTYDAAKRTAKLTGLHLTSAAAFTVTAQNVKDISGNAMTSASSFIGTVLSAASSGGFVGPGEFRGTSFGDRPNFSSSGIGFMPPVNIRPQSPFVSATSTYAFELPIAMRIPADGTIVITFPSSSDFGLCCSATSTTNNRMINDQNADINGPGNGITVGIKTLATNAQAKTITLTLDTATRSENGDTHDFLRFVLLGIKNPSVPKSFDSSGYVLDIKSKNSSGTLLESFSGNPVFITGGTAGGGSVTTIRGTVSGNGGNLEGVSVHLVSPQTGPIDATTDVSGLYQFSNIPVNSQFLTNNFGGGGEYFLSLDPFVDPTSTTTNFFGEMMPIPVRATSTSIITRDYSLTATSSAINFTVTASVAATTFGASEQLDVFAGGPGRFIARTVTPGAGILSRTTLTTVPIPQVNGSWGIGIGPAMPKGGGAGFNGPPPATTWSMPKPVEVVVSGCPSACQAAVSGVATTTYNFSVSTADKTIVGILKDGSGNALSGVEVFAFSPAAGLGSRTQTTASGAFSVAVVNGSYVVGAFSPGFGKSAEVSVVVDATGVYVDGSTTASTGSSGANPFTLKLAKPSTTITGRVTDGTSAVGNAPVFAYRTDGPGHADAMSDSSTGNYTLYVDNGTWKVGAFIPGFGPMTEQTVTVAGSSQTDINFAPSSGTTFSILSGNVYEDADSGADFDSGEGITGAIIRLSGSGGTNEGVSGADGAFTVRVPAASGYTIVDVFKPGYGRIAPLKDDGTNIGTINLTASSTQNIRVAKRNTVTINIKDSNGALLTASKAFIDLFDATTRMGNHIEITSASSTSLQIATGTSATIRAHVQGVPQANISVATDAGAATVVSSGVLTVDGDETIKITVNTSSAALSTVSGTVYSTAATAGNELADAWIQFVDETNGVQFGAQADSSGAYSLKAVDGTYKAIVSKAGYVDTPASVTISGTTAKNFILSSASLTITGTITAGGTASANSFVRAERVGGGQALAKTDTSGAYTLRVTSGTWRVFAAADGYSEGAYASNPVTVSSSVSSINIALATTVSLQSKTATSNTFTDTSAGSLTDTTVGVKVELDSSALGSSSNNAYMTAKETSNYPNTVSVNIVGSKAKDISAFSGGSQVTSLSAGKTATVELSYTVAELSSSGIDTSSEVSKLSVVSYSDDKKEWESLSTVPTYKDSTGATVTPTSNLSNVASVSFTAVGTHFSPYALSSATGSSPPSTPSGLTATGALSSIVVSWSSVSDATGYYIYRDTTTSGSFALLTDPGNVVTYTDSNAMAEGRTYFYKVSAYKESGASESSASAAVSGTVTGGGGGGGGGGGSGGGGASFAPVIPVQPAAKSTASSVAKPSAVASAVSPVFNTDLVRGVVNSDVKRLQQLLGVDPVGIFGPATERAVKAFQKKYGLPQVGRVGPATRVKLQEVYGAEAPAAAPSAAPMVAAPTGVSKTFARGIGRGAEGDDVKRLQQLLGVDPVGYFGPATERAVRAFQEKYGIANSGEAGYGYLGPRTRAKVSEVFSENTAATLPAGQAGPAVTPAPASNASANSAAIDALEAKLKALQEQLKRM